MDNKLWRFWVSTDSKRRQTFPGVRPHVQKVKPKMAEFDVQCQTSFCAHFIWSDWPRRKNNVRGLALDVKIPPLLASLSVYGKTNWRSYSRYNVELSDLRALARDVCFAGCRDTKPSQFVSNTLHFQKVLPIRKTQSDYLIHIFYGMLWQLLTMSSRFSWRFLHVAEKFSVVPHSKYLNLFMNLHTAWKIRNVICKVRQWNAKISV